MIRFTSIVGSTFSLCSVSSRCACLVACLIACMTTGTFGQTPEITATARNLHDLRIVMASLGQRGEMFGLSGPGEFLDSYQQFLSTERPLRIGMTISGDMPKFVADLPIENSQAFLEALTQSGFHWDAANGQLSRTNSSLKFFLQQSPHGVTIADSSSLLKNLQWPSPSIANRAPSSEAATSIHLDWRNLRPETRSALASQAMTLIMPEEPLQPNFALDDLPALAGQWIRWRVGAFFYNAESVTLNFYLDSSGTQSPQVKMTADVVQRSLSNRIPTLSPFTEPANATALVAMSLNMPIENTLRANVQAWAAALASGTQHVFDGDSIEDPTGQKVLQDAATVLARHGSETIGLPNLQGALTVGQSHGRAVIAGGLRLANPARLDSDLHRLVKAAIEQGAPINFQWNVHGQNDLNVHRLELAIDERLPEYRSMFGEVLVIHLATTSHALLLGVGPESDRAIMELISGQAATGNQWLAVNVAHAGKSESLSWFSFPSVQFSLAPTRDGFRVASSMPQVDPAESVKFTRLNSSQR